MYEPSDKVKLYLKDAMVQEIAMKLPKINLTKANLSKYDGDIGDKVKYSFDKEDLTLEQR
jgi:hypothetical protein